MRYVIREWNTGDTVNGNNASGNDIMRADEQRNTKSPPPPLLVIGAFFVAGGAGLDDSRLCWWDSGRGR